MLVPAGIGAHPVVFILERQTSSFHVVFINTDPHRGLAYHVSDASVANKTRYYWFALCITFLCNNNTQV